MTVMVFYGFIIGILRDNCQKLQAVKTWKSSIHSISCKRINLYQKRYKINSALKSHIICKISSNHTHHFTVMMLVVINEIKCCQINVIIDSIKSHYKLQYFHPIIESKWACRSSCCYYFTIFRSTSIDRCEWEWNEKWEVKRCFYLPFFINFLYLSLESHREFIHYENKNYKGIKDFLGLDLLILNFHIAIISIPSITSRNLIVSIDDESMHYDCCYCPVYIQSFVIEKCLFNQDQVRHLNNSIIMTTISIFIELIPLMSTTSSLTPSVQSFLLP